MISHSIFSDYLQYYLRDVLLTKFKVSSDSTTFNISCGIFNVIGTLTDNGLGYTLMIKRFDYDYVPKHHGQGQLQVDGILFTDASSICDLVKKLQGFHI